jgi:transcriptional regulator with XRE-family HTH domain
VAESKGSQALAAVCEKPWGKQKELAEKTGISQSWFSRLCNGAVLQSLDEGIAIQEHAGVPIEWWRLPPDPLATRESLLAEIEASRAPAVDAPPASEPTPTAHDSGEHQAVETGKTGTDDGSAA